MRELMMAREQRGVPHFLLLVCLLYGCVADKDQIGAAPVDCGSPGWIESPQDMSVVPGSFVFMNCRMSIPITNTRWVLNGLVDITTTSLAPRVTLLNRNHSLRFGLLEARDEAVMIGCQVMSDKYGLLPSPLATVSVLTTPHYNAKKFMVAVAGRPFEMDMGFTGSRPPTSFVWMKNGMLFRGDGVRVRVNHNRIAFSEVRSDDYGRYTVMARNRAGTGRAYTVLKVLAWPDTNTDNITTLSPHLALLVALAQQSNNTRFNTPSSQSSHTVDRLGVMATIRRLLFHATTEAQRQGTARIQLEELLERVMAMIGHRNEPLRDSDLEIINKATKCDATLPKFDCSRPEVLSFRTYDGTCNNLFYPLNGAALTAFPRFLPALYEDDISSPVGLQQAVDGHPTSSPWPSPRYLSWRLGAEIPVPRTPTTGITHMVMQWGQFLDHDVDLSPVFDVECGCNYTKTCTPIIVAENDDVFGIESSNGGTCLSFSRSIPACQVKSTTNIAREQINQITSYIDGSQIYGSSRKLALSLRLKTGGLLKQGGKAESSKGNLPFQKDRPKGSVLPFFIAGDKRANEQTGLIVMHTLWLREHNRIARTLAKMNPCWDDERLYQEARKIVGAELQKITFYGFLPAVFGSYQSTFIHEYTGYSHFVDASVLNSFAAGAYRFGHSLVRSQLLRLNENFTAMDIGHLDLSRAFFKPMTYFESFGTDGIARGLMVDVASPADEVLSTVLTTELFAKEPGGLGGDLASLNIQRGRDHGLPSYRTWQRACEEVFPGHPAEFRDDGINDLLRDMYGEEGFEHRMDLWMGGLAEETLEGAQVGPTFACILGISFSRVRDGDRFWFEEEKQFSEGQRETLKETSLARVICDNGDNIKTVSRNVFQSESERVACEELPHLDLKQWEDFTCGSS